MKIVQQAAAVLARVLARLDRGELAEAQEVTEDALHEFVGLTWAEVDERSSDELIALLAHGESGGIGRLLLLADLLRARSLISAEHNAEHRQYHDLVKALTIRLQLALGHDLVNAHLDSNIDTLVNDALEGYLLPTEVVAMLFSYYEKTEQYDRAEDALWELIEDHITQEDMVVLGLEFYERLLRKTESQLRTGNMTRQEVEDAFEELWARQSDA